MSKSKSEKSQQDSASSGGKKTVPINHLILKRVNDLKAMVGNLSESSTSDSGTDSELTTEVHRQSTEIIAIRQQLRDFQQSMLADFCNALDERLTQRPNLASTAASRITDHLSSDPQPSPALTRNESPPINQNPVPEASATVDQDGEEGLKEETWESIRSAFLNDHDIEEADELLSDVRSEVSKSTGIDASQQDPFPEDQHVAADDFEEVDLLEVQQYEVVSDLTTLDKAQLRETVENQERVISVLIRKLQVRHNSRPTMTQEQLAVVQALAEEDLAAEIRETLAVLHDLQRQGELELSLERARLSRRRTNLDQLAERIEGRARTLGVTIKDDGTIEDATTADRGTGSKSRRWLGAMGFGNS